jgi:hypothetical protein
MIKAVFAALSLIAALLLVAPHAANAQQAPPSPAPSASPSLTPSPMPSETPLPSPLPSGTPSPAPSSTPTPLPSVTPLPSPTPTTTPSPAPTATPLPTPLVLPPDAPPQILAIQLSDPVFHSGELVTGTIITSTNVAAVEIRLMGKRARIPRADFGVFQLSYKMPRVPFWMRKAYTAQVVAMNSTGVETERDITVSIR